MSAWSLFCRGTKFRRAFSPIGELRGLTKAPFMSLTASAPPAVESELVRSVHLDNLVFVRKSLDRPNIFYSVGKKSVLTVSFQNCYTKRTVITHLQIDRLT